MPSEAGRWEFRRDNSSFQLIGGTGLEVGVK